MKPKRYEKELFPKKTRLLLYIRDKDLIEVFSDTKIKLTDLQRELGYNSPSHLYQDLQDLQQAGYIKYDQTKDAIKITEKGKQLTEHYWNIRLLGLILIVFGFGSLPVFLYAAEWIWFYSILLSAASLSCGILIMVNLWKLIKEKMIF
jgi:predicted transcriptional regulator